MTMDLKEALEVVEGRILRPLARLTPRYRSAALESEALGVVLAAARENHAGALAAKVQQTATEVFRATPHQFLPFTLGSAGCSRCLFNESNPIHRLIAP